jgi:ribosomal protein S27AE
MKKGYTVTERCHANRWGDPAGHAKRGERLCPRCTVLVAARMRRWNICNKPGAGMRLTKRELLLFVREFNAAWNPETRDTDTAFQTAIESVVREGMD